MRLPEPRRSRAVLIGTSEYADNTLADIPAIETTINTLAAALTNPEDAPLPPGSRYCVTIINEGDLRAVGSQLGTAAEEATDLLFVYYSGRVLRDQRTRSLHLGLPDSDPKRPRFNSLEYAMLRDTVLDSRASMKVLVLDSRLPDGMSGIGDEFDVKGGYVLASSFGEEAASVPAGQIHTAFSGHLATVLREGVPGGPGLLRIDDIYACLLNRMRQDGLPDPEARGTYADGPLALMRNPGSLSVPQLSSARPSLGMVVDQHGPRLSEPGYAAEPDEAESPGAQAAGEPASGEEPVRWFNEWMLGWMAGAADRLTESASSVAVTLLSRAAASVEPGTERYAWYASRLAQALFRAGDLDRAREVVGVALGCTDDTDVRVHLQSTLAQCLDKAGSPKEALAVVDKALGTPGLTDRHRAGLLVLAARSHNTLGEFPKAVEIASEALKTASAAGDESAADWALHIISMAKAMAAADTDFVKLQES